MLEVEEAMISGRRERGAVRQVLQQALEDAQALARVPRRLFEYTRKEPGAWRNIAPVGAELYLALPPLAIAGHIIASGGNIPTAVLSAVVFEGIQCGAVGVCLEMEPQAEIGLLQAS
mgnify:CR=1 FL=1